MLNRIFLSLVLLFLGGGCTEEQQTPSSDSAPLEAMAPLFYGSEPIPQADSLMVDVGDTRLFVSSMGTGPTLLMIHGGPGLSHHYFRPALDFLGRGYRVVYYDQRLSGRSDAECDTSLVTMNQWVEDVEAIRQVLGVEKLSVIAHSWGVRVGLRYAALYPERVEKIAFLNPVGLNPVYVQEAVSTLQSRITAQDQLAQQEVINSEAYQLGDPEAILKAYRLSFDQNIYQKSILDSLQLYIPDRATVRQQTLARLYRDPALQTYNDYSFLDRVKAPSLVVWGTYEANPKPAITEMMSHLSGSRLAEIPDCGHFPFLESPINLARELEAFFSEN